MIIAIETMQGDSQKEVEFEGERDSLGDSRVRLPTPSRAACDPLLCVDKLKFLGISLIT